MFPSNVVAQREAMRAAAYERRVIRLRDSLRRSLPFRNGEPIVFVSQRAEKAVMGKRTYDYTGIDKWHGGRQVVVGYPVKDQLPKFVVVGAQVLYYNDNNIVGKGEIEAVDFGDRLVVIRLDDVVPARERDRIKHERDALYDAFKRTSGFKKLQEETIGTKKLFTLRNIIGASSVEGGMDRCFSRVEMA